MTALSIEREQTSAPLDVTRRDAALAAAAGLLVMAVLSPFASFTSSRS